MRRPVAARLSVATLAAASLLLAGCAAPAPAPASGGSDEIDVVASTNVYGDIAQAIGGDKVSVTAIITKTSQDPHSYEATAQDRLAVSKADVVIENGGGYDDFLTTLTKDSAAGTVLNAVELSGLEHDDAHDDGAHGDASSGTAGATAPATEAADDHGHDHGDFNEHVWYSLPAMEKVADGIAAKFSELEPGSSATFQANAGTFKTSLAAITATLDTLKTTAKDDKVAVTEPVPLYLLSAAGLVNVTPEAYTAAIEEGSDVPPASLKEATDLVSSGSVRLLAYNEQTAGPQTEALKKAADAAGVPVVDFTETLPEGKTYLQWMTDNVGNVSKILEKNS